MVVIYHSSEDYDCRNEKPLLLGTACKARMFLHLSLCIHQTTRQALFFFHLCLIFFFFFMGFTGQYACLKLAAFRKCMVVFCLGK